MNIQAQTALDIGTYVQSAAREARHAARGMGSAPGEARNGALIRAADLLDARRASLRRANRLDLEKARQSGLADAMIDRLELTDERIATMIDGLRQTAALPDPVGEVTEMRQRPSGIRVGRMRVPIGVVGFIYESRPNVTADAGALCIKSGNCVILRGGSEAFHSNCAIAECLREGLRDAGLPEHGLQLIETTDRAAIRELIALDDLVDVIIPRGGKGLIETISEHAKVPVIKHLDGVCHVYVDTDADLEKAVRVAFNAKTHRYGVCNAMETLLVARPAASEFLAAIIPRFKDAGVELRGCAAACEFDSDIAPASESDWYAEYLAPILAVRVVDDLDQAIDHIERYGSAHTDSIVTESISSAQRFVNEVDSSSVMVNASTRFSDGYEYGLGAEIGISTNKLHARGPVGLEGLTIQKYVVYGDGTVRE